MAKRKSLSFFLLLGFSLASIPTQATMATTATTWPTQSIAQQRVETPANPATEPATSTAATLTLEDLPAGFQKLPPQIAAQMASRLSSLGQKLGQENLKPENFFAFVNPQKFQIVLGFTTKLPEKQAQASFDASIQQLEKPEVQQRMQILLQEQLKTLGGAKVTECKALPGLNNLANASTALTIGIEMQGQPLRMDVAAFRRNSVGAFTGVMYTNDRSPELGVGDVARKLDGRIVKLASANNRSQERNAIKSSAILIDIASKETF